MVKAKQQEEKLTTDEVGEQIPPEAQDMLNKLLNPQADSNLTDEQKMGVLQRLVQAVTNDKNKEYRQTIHTGNFANEKQAHLFARALNMVERYGGDVGFLMNHAEADNGVKGEAKNKIMEALTHYTFSTNYQGQKNQPNKNKRSPL